MAYARASLDTSAHQAHPVVYGPHPVADHYQREDVVRRLYTRLILSNSYSLYIRAARQP